MSRPSLVCLLFFGTLSLVSGAQAGQAEGPNPAPAAPAAQDLQSPPARPVEVDQALVNTFTTLPLKKNHGYFRLTHRFARDLGRDSFGSLTEDLFGLDNGAVMGLEFRWGITSKLQAGVHRSTLGKTLQPFGRWDA